MIDVHVDVDLKSFEKEMAVFPDQIEWATATAINKTLVDAQKAEREHLADAFTLRRPGFVNSNIKVKPFANKETLTGQISVTPPGNAADLLSKFEDGGTKESIKPSGNVAIPTDTIQPDESKVIPQSKRPKNLAGVFRMALANGKTVLATHQLRGNKGALSFVYSLVKSVKIPKKLAFEDTVMKTVDARWNQNFNESFERAMATATKKSVDNAVDSLLG